MTLCVYAIAPPVRGRSSVTGLAGERVTPVSAAGLSAFVGVVSRIPRPTAASLQQYDRVIRALSRRASALLPARYGTELRDAEELQAILRSRAASLRRQLALVRSRAQMTIRLVHSDRPVARTLPGPRAQKSGSGTAYLRARAREAAVPQFDPLRDAVRRWVRAERADKRAGVATIYHLVPRGSVEPYRRALIRASVRSGVALVVSGPWPPYAFADPLS